MSQIPSRFFRKTNATAGPHIECVYTIFAISASYFSLSDASEKPMNTILGKILAMRQSIGHFAEKTRHLRRRPRKFPRIQRTTFLHVFQNHDPQACFRPICNFVYRSIKIFIERADVLFPHTVSKPRGGLRSRRFRSQLETLEVRQLLSGDFQLLKDITTLPDSQGSNPSNFTQVGSTLFFTASTATHGTELWKTDGTESGTKLVKDVFPGSGNSNALHLTNLDGTLYFTADDGIHGKELWKSDGTAAGTMLVRDIKSGSGTSNPSGLTSLNGKLYFFA